MPGAIGVLRELLPYVTQIVTAIVAIVAIVASRRSSKDTLAGQLDQRLWEKRGEIYEAILRETKRIDPNRLKTPHGYLKDVNKDPGLIVTLLPVDQTGEEWRNFEATIEAFASEKVRYLYSLWDATIAGWTWATFSTVIHTLPESEHQNEMETRLDRSLKSVALTREQLVSQIRSELRFEDRAVPEMKCVRPEGFMGAITEIEFDSPTHIEGNLRPVRAARVTTMSRTIAPDGWDSSVDLA